VVFQKFATKFNRHSGQVGVIPAFARRRDPESRHFKDFWITVFTGMTVRAFAQFVNAREDLKL